MPRYARAMERLGTETAFEVLARAKKLEAQGREIVHLEIGEPDFDTPKNIIEAGKKALEEGYTHYGPSAGLPEFREMIGKHIAEDRGIPVGGAVQWSYIVTNTGNVTLTDIAVTDDILGPIGTIPSLAPGASDSLIVTTGIAAAGQYANEGKALATFEGSEISDT